MATRVDEKVLVMTGTWLGPPADSTRSVATRVRLESGTWTTADERDAVPRSASAAATTSRNSPDAEIPMIASRWPSAGG